MLAPIRDGGAGLAVTHGRGVYEDAGGFGNSIAMRFLVAAYEKHVLTFCCQLLVHRSKYKNIYM